MMEGMELDLAKVCRDDRDIYRYWDTLKGEFFYFQAGVEANYRYDGLYLNQCIGLRDKNGCRIFDQDILLVPVKRFFNGMSRKSSNKHHGVYLVYGLVEWSCGYFGEYGWDIRFNHKQLDALKEPRGQETCSQSVQTHGWNLLKLYKPTFSLSREDLKNRILNKYQKNVEVIGNMINNPELMDETESVYRGKGS